MAKIIKEIGLKRIFKYLVFGAWDLVFGALPYSPLSGAEDYHRLGRQSGFR
ncbi:MAG: hypothetical protein UX97_C0001G0082 [Candidatus Beckwithbacteria bacterium GW2011_GWA2_47_25]|nr:MAG: hypothetical protein UX97_C0001G0082 [Candidatus Beckwithbacteria bacterium GW2011_GWA2_47_25]